MCAKDLKHDKSLVNNFTKNTDEFKSSPVYIDTKDDL